MPIVTQIAPADAVVHSDEHLAEAIAFATKLTTALSTFAIHLFKQGEVTATPDTTFEAFDAARCDYTAYAPAELADVPLEPFTDPEDGSLLVVIPSQQFNHGAVGVANTVGGWWIENDENEVVMCGNLPEPVTLTGPLDSLVLVVGRRFGP